MSSRVMSTRLSPGANVDEMSKRLVVPVTVGGGGVAMIEHERVPGEAPSRPECACHPLEHAPSIGPGRQMEERPIRADHEIARLLVVEVAHVRLVELQLDAGLRCALARDGEHRGGEVDPDHALPGALRDRYRDPTRTCRQLDDRAVGLLGEADVVVDVLRHVRRPRVVHGGKPLVAAHRRDSSRRRHVGNLGAPVDAQALEHAALAAVEAATSVDEIEHARVEFLGRKSELKLALREVRDRETGMALNALRERLEGADRRARCRVSSATSSTGG